MYWYDKSHPHFRQLRDDSNTFWRWYRPARRDYNPREDKRASLADLDRLETQLKHDIAQLATRGVER